MENVPQVAQLEKIYVPDALPQQDQPPSELHCWYLGYGSNMSEKSFLQRRGIRPLRSLVVHAPSVQLAFNLPGIPYIEPRFANVNILSDEEIGDGKWDEKSRTPWGKGCVGVAYYITLEDMAHILTTEGGGASYQVIQVECTEIGGQGEKIRANTLCASDPSRLRTQLGQPSPRYMQLLRTGAREKSLPESYIAHLDAVETYHRRGFGTSLGMVLFVLVLAPIFLTTVLLSRLLKDKNGASPKWMQKGATVMFSSAWKFHDKVTRPIFGSGEVTKTDH